MMYSKLGHTFFFNNTDVFVESDTRKITDALVVKILNTYQNKTNSFFNIDSDVINYFKPRIQYATYDLRETENKVIYHRIETKYGVVSAPVNDKSIIIILNQN